MKNTSRNTDYIEPVPIDSLRPTQITVGMKEVDDKRRHWKTQGLDKKTSFVKDHRVPVIFGPSRCPLYHQASLSCLRLA